MIHLFCTFFLIVVSSLTLHAEESIRLKYTPNQTVHLHADFVGDCHLKTNTSSPVMHSKESFEGMVTLDVDNKANQTRFPYEISYMLVDYDHQASIPSKDAQTDAISLFSTTRSEADDEMLKKFKGYVVPLKIDTKGNLVLVHPEEEIKFPQISYVEDWLFGKHILAGVKDLFLLAGKDIKKGEKYPYQSMRKIADQNSAFEVRLDGTVEIIEITAEKVIAHLFLNVDSTEVLFKSAELTNNNWQEVPVQLSGIWIGKAVWDRENALNFKSEGQGIWEVKHLGDVKSGDKLANCESRFTGRIYTTPAQEPKAEEK